MASSTDQRTILVVDDDQELLRAVEKALQREGFRTAAAASGKEAEAWLAQHSADLLLLGLRLKDIRSADLVRQLADKGHGPPFVIITGPGDERAAVDLMKRGVIDHIFKDVGFLQFLPEVVKRAFERIEKERRLAAAEDQLRLVLGVVEQGFSAVLILDASFPDPSVVYANPSFSQVTGYRLEKVIGQRLSGFSYLAALHERLRQGMAEGQRFWEETFSFQTAGGERLGEWRVGPVSDRSGRVAHWLVILRDITERKRLEKEILEISDRERRRIGQDLHDGLCQQLAGIELMSQVVAQKLAAKSKADSARVSRIAKYVREAISQTRLLARGLSPVMLDSEGLMSALQELVFNTGKMFGVACAFECNPAVLVPDHAVATHLYRIAQEAASNAIKHGKAKQITIRLKAAGEKYVLSVEDDGIGLPKNISDNKGTGLRIMEYRAGMVGGALMVERNLNRGTSVVCSVPRLQTTERVNPS